MENIALVHDQLTVYGGAERVLDTFCEMFPSAPIYTTVYDPSAFPSSYSNKNIKTSFIQNIPLVKNSHSLRAPLYPFGIESFDLSKYNVVLSDSQGISKGCITSTDSLHISYIHTVPWFLWKLKPYTGRYFSSYIGRIWDYISAQRPDVLIANSENTKKRIGKFYKRDAQVIYPPVEISKLQNLTQKINLKDEYIVFLGRLEGYKGELEIAKFCTENKIKLMVIGKGSNEKILSSYSQYVELKNDVDDEQKAVILAKALCLFNGSNEDFGINMAEAIAVGTPVIALKKGGAMEIIKEGVNGIFVDDLSNQTLFNAFNDLKSASFNKQLMQKSVEKFSKENFIYQIHNVIKESSQLH